MPRGSGGRVCVAYAIQPSPNSIREIREVALGKRYSEKGHRYVPGGGRVWVGLCIRGREGAWIGAGEGGLGSARVRERTTPVNGPARR